MIDPSPMHVFLGSPGSFVDVAVLCARSMLVVVFTLAAAAKLVDRVGARQAVRDFGVPESLASPVSLLLPSAELAVAVGLLFAPLSAWGAGGALLLLGLFVVGIGSNLARGNTPDCHCFGQLYSKPIGASTLVRNIALACVAIFVLAARGGHPDIARISILHHLTGADQIAIALGILSLLLASLQWWFILHPPVWLANRIPWMGGISLVQAPVVSAVVVSESDEAVAGLPVGSAAPQFRLPGLYGEMMTLDALRAGRKAVVLLFVSPSCAPCLALMPDISRWQAEYSGALRFVLISSGSADANRAKADEYGVLEVLLQKDFEVGTAYRAGGTPSAVIVHPSGVIGSPIGTGADLIRALIDQYVGLLAAGAGLRLDESEETELERARREAANPFTLGAAAPDSEFVDSSGNIVGLSAFRGRDVVVLFWDVNCRFCQQMVAALRAWEESPPQGAPELIVVLQEPLQSGRDLGLRSRVLIDRESAASRAFHSSGTPTAITLDDNAHIASQPAVGAESIGLLLHLEPIPSLVLPIPLLPQAPPRPSVSPLYKSIYPGAPLVLPDVIDLYGATVRLSASLIRDTIVLFWNSFDASCRALEPNLKSWEMHADSDAPEILVVVPGSMSENQVVGFQSRVVIDLDGSAAKGLGVQTMPTAILLNAEGIVAADPAVGGAAVMRLLQSTSPELAEVLA